MRQLALLLLLLPFVTTSTIVCPSGFSKINGNKCVKIIKNSLKHGGAETDCKYLGGTLTVIQNSIDNRAISQLAANAGLSNIWLGLFCFSNSTSGCYWDNASGTASNYSNFIAGHPLVNGGFGGCVYMSTSTGQWTSAKCEVVGMPFVCEIPPTYQDSCTHNFNGYCYFPSQEFAKKSHNLTYAHAQSLCQSNFSANLVSIHSKMELDYIKTIYRDSSVNVTQFFIGAKATLPETFNWADGTPWDTDYSNPMNRTQSNCMVMDAQGVGLWSQVDCQNMNYFMCKRKAGSSGDSKDSLNAPVQNPQKMISVDASDFSNCNATFLLAPGIITSPNYPSNFPASYCTYSLRALGPYQVAVYVTDVALSYGNIDIYDEYGSSIMSNSYYGGVAIAPTNIATVRFYWDGFGNSNRGFEAKFLGI